MKIAMVAECASPLTELGGGAASGRTVAVGALAAALVRAGHEVTVYTRRQDPHTRTEVPAREGYRVVHVPAGPPRPLPRDQILPHLGEFGTFLRKHWALRRPEVVHAHFWMSALAAELAARSHDLPVVVSFHGLGTVRRRFHGLADTSPRPRIRFERLIATRATQVLATCSDEVTELTRMGVPRFRISVVPGGVDLATFTPDGGAAGRRQPHRLLAVGRLVRRKGFDLAVRTLAELPDTELVIAGGAVGDGLDEDTETRRLRRLAADYGVAERLRMLGPVSHATMPRLYRSADVALCTSWYEPFGLVPLEAMACGTPVVATAVGGMLDTVVDGVTGRLVAPPEPATIARAVRALLDDPVRRESWGAAGIQRVRERYSWDRIAAETVTTYERATPIRSAPLRPAPLPAVATAR
ncbi:glycosyltransferase [Nocardia sp. XZ_19_385]|uniref:glycosyltransferase n=1 Tax=Nocardia sp. XZ_19_385 TaxID=2769488 RepID=UPI00188EF63A|nr:glycosyltransferase [Nocardia sp. XZ_19_385]